MNEDGAADGVDDVSTGAEDPAPWPTRRAPNLPFGERVAASASEPAAVKSLRAEGVAGTNRVQATLTKGNALDFLAKASIYELQGTMLEIMLCRPGAPIKFNLRTLSAYASAIAREFAIDGMDGQSLKEWIVRLVAQKKALQTDEWGSWINSIGRVNSERVESALKFLRSQVISRYGSRKLPFKSRGAPARVIYEWVNEAPEEAATNAAVMRRVVHGLVRAAENPNAFSKVDRAVHQAPVSKGDAVEALAAVGWAHQVDDDFMLIKPWRPTWNSNPVAAAVRTTLQLMLSLLDDSSPQRWFVLSKWARHAAADLGFVGNKERGRDERALLLGLVRDLVKRGHAKVHVTEGITFIGVPRPAELELVLAHEMRELNQEVRKSEGTQPGAPVQGLAAQQESGRARPLDGVELGAAGNRAGKDGVFTYVRDGVAAFDARHGVIRGTSKSGWAGAKSKARALRGKTYALRAAAEPPAQPLIHPAPAPAMVVPRRISRASVDQRQRQHQPPTPGHDASHSGADLSAQRDSANETSAEELIVRQVSDHRARRLRQLASRRATLQVVPVIKPPQEDGGLELLDLINQSADIKPRR